MKARLVMLAIAGVVAGQGTVGAAAAGSGACTVLTDATADVQAAAGATVPDEHLDVTGVAIRPGRGELTFTIQAAGLDERRQGEWRLTFRAGRTDLFVSAGIGMWLNVGDYTGPVGFHAGVTGRPATTVRGTFDYAASEIRVAVPHSALRLGSGIRLDRFAIAAKETFLSVAPMSVSVAQAALADQGTSDRSYLVGRGC